MGHILDSSVLIEDDPRIVLSKVVIIGTGPAGMFVALKVLKLGYSVLMVEAGNEMPDVDASKYFTFAGGNAENARNLGVNWQLGGASNLWSGRCAPLQRILPRQRDGL